VEINNDNVQKHNQLMILMRSDFCHSIENQNKFFRPRSIIVILYTKNWSDIRYSYSIGLTLVTTYGYSLHQVKMVELSLGRCDDKLHGPIITLR
jgi:hypothetical protein